MRALALALTVVLLLASGVAKVLPREPFGGGGKVLGMIEIAIAATLVIPSTRLWAVQAATVLVSVAAGVAIWDGLDQERTCSCFGGWIALAPWIRLLLLGTMMTLLGVVSAHRSGYRTPR